MLSFNEKITKLSENCYPFKGKNGNCCITDFCYDIIFANTMSQAAAKQNHGKIIQGKDDGYEVYNCGQEY